MPSIYPPGAPPTWQVPQPLLKRRRPAPVDFPRSYTFDPVTGDFATDGAGRVPRCGQHAAAAQRAAKAATTQQGAYTRIYSRGFGTDLEGVTRSRPRAQAERLAETRIRRAVRRRDNRVRDAVDFVFVWDEMTRLTVTWTLLLADGTRVRQEVPLDRFLGGSTPGATAAPPAPPAIYGRGIFGLSEYGE